MSSCPGLSEHLKSAKHCGKKRRSYMYKRRRKRRVAEPIGALFGRVADVKFFPSPYNPPDAERMGYEVFSASVFHQRNGDRKWVVEYAFTDDDEVSEVTYIEKLEDVILNNQLRTEYKDNIQETVQLKYDWDYDTAGLRIVNFNDMFLTLKEEKMLREMAAGAKTFLTRAPAYYNSDDPIKLQKFNLVFPFESEYMQMKAYSMVKDVDMPDDWFDDNTRQQRGGRWFRKNISRFSK